MLTLSLRRSRAELVMSVRVSELDSFMVGCLECALSCPCAASLILGNCTAIQREGHSVCVFRESCRWCIYSDSCPGTQFPAPCFPALAKRSFELVLARCGGLTFFKLYERFY